MSQIANIALLGAGWWAQGWHLPHLKANPKAVIAAIVEPAKQPRSTLVSDMDSFEQLSARYNAPVFESFDALLASPLRERLDGVLIAAPHAAHFELGVKAINAGLHVFMEKPMTTDLVQAQKLAAAACATDKIFMVNNTANWRPCTRAAREMVENGDIGEVRHVCAFFAANLGWLFNDPANAGWVQPTQNMKGNGFGWGQFSHTMAWIFMVSGLTPTSVFAFAKGSEITGADMYDAVTILCTNGATVSVSGVAAIPGTSKHIDNRIIGSEGMISYCGRAIDGALGKSEECPGQLELTRFDGKDRVIKKFEFENLDQEGTGPESLNEFINGCLGEPFYQGVGAEVGLAAVATIDAMYRSIESGKAEPTYLQ
ncbi:hypothetical protein CYMTET_20705 [Cymbomonas tetramitiformis]|uniref:Oxidoreductase n=1 Tax=Cymbomonas tetramitiformis TaxID=36881 RepID=A0AAE0G4T2_9CHLO|nr:hypothetical protein CYMTET_20705 [Cymbomonas tetramitiformis]